MLSGSCDCFIEDSREERTEYVCSASPICEYVQTNPIIFYFVKYSELKSFLCAVHSNSKRQHQYKKRRKKIKKGTYPSLDNNKTTTMMNTNKNTDSTP